MDITTLSNDLKHMIPELILALGAMSAVLAGAFMGAKSSKWISYFCVLLLLAAGYSAVRCAPLEPVEIFRSSLIIDNFGGFAKLIIALTSAAAVLLSIDYLTERKIDKPEYPVLAVLAVLGMYIMASAHDLIAIYMGVELQSLALYVLASYARDSAKSTEAGVKYFVLGALSSGILLYGASLIYGFTGSVNFTNIGNSALNNPSVGLTFGMVFVLSGLAFKMSVAPFHMWTPDVYEGSPTPSTAFFAAAPKMAAAILLARFCFDAFGDVPNLWKDIIAIMAVLSMFVGAIFALQQTNVKRLFAYSSIANMGYALVAIAAWREHGVTALLLFVSIYAISSVGLFGVLLSMRDNEGKALEKLSDFSGLSRQRPMLAVALTVLLFSIAGIPPLAGFFGKFEVFIAAVNGQVVPLALVLVIASVISAFYYLRIIKIVWFDEAKKSIAGGLATTRFSVAGTTLVLAALTPFIGLLYAAAKLGGNFIK